MRHRAAIVGLGRVGMLFDDDPRRTRVWTHFTAYERLADRFDLVAVCDPDADRRAAAVTRLPDVRDYASLGELLDSESLDVVSICTPVPLHAEQIEACAPRVRAIVCEKPLSTDVASAERASAACAETGTLLAVNYYKRFETAVDAAHGLVNDGELGDARAATALYSGPLDAVGSHAVDLLHFLLGPLEVTAAEDGSALLRFGERGFATLVRTGPRDDLVFEVDVLGSEGRARILDNCERIEVSRFAASPRYDGYRELVTSATRNGGGSEPFLRLFEEVVDALDGGPARLRSDGESALGSQRILDAIEAHGARS
jgi:predicted dehydrogenase